MGLYLCRSIVLHTCKCIKLQQLRSFDLAWCVLDLQCVVKHLASVPLWLAPAEPTHFTGRLFMHYGRADLGHVLERVRVENVRGGRNCRHFLPLRQPPLISGNDLMDASLFTSCGNANGTNML